MPAIRNIETKRKKSFDDAYLFSDLLPNTSALCDFLYKHVSIKNKVFVACSNQVGGGITTFLAGMEVIHFMPTGAFVPETIFDGLM